MSRPPKSPEQMTRAELIRSIRALEQRSPTPHISFGQERLLHELQVHQVELETQNRELREAQLLLEGSRDRYADLYDFAPVGYVTFDDKGVIQEINLTAAGMLGVERTRLAGVPFHLHVAREDLVQFRKHLGRREVPEERLTTELLLARRDGVTLPVVMQSVRVYDAEKEAHLCRATLTDISRRKQAEEALRDERDFVSAVLETAGALVVVLDEAGRVVRFNRACERLTGYESGETLGKPIWNLLLPPEEIAAVQAVFSQLQAEQLPNHHENHWLTKAGDRRLIAWSNTVLKMGAGKGRHFVGTGLDITERNREELQRRLLYEVSSLLGSAGSLAEVVPRLLQTLAEAFQWDVGELWEAVGDPKDLRMVHVWHAPGKKLAAFVKRSLKHSFPMFDGLPGQVLSTQQPAWIPEIAQCPYFDRRREAVRAGLRSAVAFPIQLHGQTLGVMAFLSHQPKAADKRLLQMFAAFGSQIGQFIERKRAEQALREANEFGQQVMDGAQAGIVVYDREGRFLAWNSFMEQLSGYRAEEVLGRHTLEVFPFLKEQHFEAMFQRALAGEVFDGSDTPFAVPEKGKHGWKVDRFSPLRDARQEIAGVIVAVRDITDRRRMETELLEISDREQRRIGHDLHDGLGQQLTGLEMKLYGLMEDLAERDLASRRKHLQEQAAEINQGLRECITATRSLAHGLTPAVIKTGGLMGALEHLARLTRVPGKIACRFVCPVPVALDDDQTAGHLHRIAQEAVNNALKHARARRITIQLTRRQGALRLQIKDDGRGFPDGMGSRSGMGLEVMRHRAHVIGASLGIDSKPGHGVSVTCTLPWKET